MPHRQREVGELARENEDLRLKLEVAEETLRAIRANEVDGLVVEHDGEQRVYTLRGADESYRIFVETMQQGAATVAADGTIMYCNRAFAESLQSPLEKTIGTSIYSLVMPDDEGILRSLLWECMTGSCTNQNITLRSTTGSEVAVVLAMTPLVVQGATSVCITVTDLTEHNARIAAEAANAAKDRFIAVLSHELRTPLSPIVMTVSAMAGDSSLPAQVREDLAMVRRNIELETRLIDDLLDLSRITSGKLRLQIERVGLHSLVDSVLEMLQSEVRQKSLKLRCDLVASTHFVDGDSARLHQILWNIIRNAIKFSHEGGTVSVRTCDTPGGFVVFEVRDEGVGIDADMLPRIFNAFEQGGPGDRQRPAGLGLGLTISKTLVEMHGGTLSVESDGLNRGSLFRVLLPLSKQEASAVGVASADVIRDFAAASLRLLLVEDHRETAAVLGRLLRQRAHQVMLAGSIAEALELASRYPFDVVVSDLGLPDGNGHELMKIIKQKYGIPGIALTGYGMEDDMTRSRAAGFVAHVVKPVSISHLESVIGQVAAKTGDLQQVGD
jgi:PAS domain S-box-containing protein